jgi:hypothetical protein
MAGILYSALAKYPGPPTAAGRKNCVAALQRLAVMAEDVDVSLCLEVVNRCAGSQFIALGLSLGQWARWQRVHGAAVGSGWLRCAAPVGIGMHSALAGWAWDRPCTLCHSLFRAGKRPALQWACGKLTAYPMRLQFGDRPPNGLILVVGVWCRHTDQPDVA